MVDELSVESVCLCACVCALLISVTSVIVMCFLRQHSIFELLYGVNHKCPLWPFFFKYLQNFAHINAPCYTKECTQ